MMFNEIYSKLNTAQKEAVETLDGPVMVVAGPGTGKTQVLALRIANILKKTDVGADSILSLTFTRSGVLAMKERLESYIGSDAHKVPISTFHSFAHDLIEKYYRVLDFDTLPTLLDDTEAVLLIDELLHLKTWEYITPRTNPGQYFNDLKQLISLLKRERMTPAQFLSEIDHEIENLSNDPANISSRGKTKGVLKKDIEKKIESLNRTKEVVLFYREYEALKRERAVMDYDDVLEFAVMIVEASDEVKYELREEYQYVLIDEHQDSSGIQNAFIKAVWQGVESPNIFVVGDDRQLIYGFSGASLSYFEEFKELFGKAKLITLSENYRSTEKILSLADDLLKSTISNVSLKSNTKEGTHTGLFEYAYERDEILGAIEFFKEKIKNGAKPESCVLLVPKNRHVRSAVELMRAKGLPTTLASSLSLFSQKESEDFLTVLQVISNPFDHRALSQSLLTFSSQVSPLVAHTFLHEQKGREFTLDTMIHWGDKGGLFDGQSPLSSWGEKLKIWIETTGAKSLPEIISIIGNDLLVDREQTHESLMSSVEVVRSFLHMAINFEEKQKGKTLKEFLIYIERLKTYNHDISLATLESAQGVSVMTLHRSKGLEYDYVWVANMNEETFMSQKRNAFTLPEVLKARLEKRDVASSTRELYVAITRAKMECIISYSKQGYDGRELTLANIIQALPQSHFIQKDKNQTERELLLSGPENYIRIEENTQQQATTSEVETYVSLMYKNIRISVTLINNFFDCPWKWYFRNFLKLPEVKTTALSLGTVVHATLEYILTQINKPQELDLKEKIKFYLKHEGVENTQDVNRLTTDALKAVTSWLSIYYPHLAKDRQSERSVQAKDKNFPHLQLYGKIDLTERFPDGSIVVTDFKTGKTKTPSEIEKITDEGRLSDYLRQLAMYSYLLKLSEDKRVEKSRLLFIESDSHDEKGLYETSISEEEIDLLIRDIKEYDVLLQSGNWTQRQCNFKGYGMQSECEYCRLANKIFKK